jgi:hypothetical protein
MRNSHPYGHRRRGCGHHVANGADGYDLLARPARIAERFTPFRACRKLRHSYAPGAVWWSTRQCSKASLCVMPARHSRQGFSACLGRCPSAVCDHLRIECTAPAAARSATRSRADQGKPAERPPEVLQCCSGFCCSGFWKIGPFCDMLPSREEDGIVFHSVVGILIAITIMLSWGQLGPALRDLFRGGPKPPSHPLPGDDSKILNRRRAKPISKAA